MFIIDRGGYTHTMFNFHLGYSVINSAVDIQCSIDLNQSEEEPITSYELQNGALSVFC